MSMKWIYLTLLVLVLVLGFYSGVGWEQTKAQTAKPSTVEEAILFLEEARATHQAFVDNPEWIREGLGDWNHHKRWVERYSSIITLLEREDRGRMYVDIDRLNKVGVIVIKTIIRLKNDMVMVFDAEGEQVPEYQGQYKDVRWSILGDAPPEVVFTHWFDYSVEPEIIHREEW